MCCIQILSYAQTRRVQLFVISHLSALSENPLLSVGGPCGDVAWRLDQESKIAEDCTPPLSH